MHDGLFLTGTTITMISTWPKSPEKAGGQQAEVRAILKRAADEPAIATDQRERFPDWFIRMARPGIDLDPAIEENRTPHEGVDL